MFSGSATIADGRLRHFSLPHSLEAINGRLSFDAGGIRLDDVAARLGGGDVTFGGRIGLNGFTLGDLNLTATGERMRSAIPRASARSSTPTCAAGHARARCVLSGNVVVQDGVWSKRIETSPDLFNLAGTAATALGVGAPRRRRSRCGSTSTSTRRRRLRIENNIANMVASADLQLQGTYDRPLLFGRAEIERGDIVFEGNRYVVTPGGSIDFFNPSRIEPFFDIEAETRVRAPGPDLPRDARLQRHDEPVQLLAQLGSAAARSRHRLAALRPGRRTSSDAELRALRLERGAAVGGGAAAGRR